MERFIGNIDPRTMELFHAAWTKVQRKNGAPGIDGETVSDFGERSEYNLARMASDFEDDIYELSPLKCVFIPKESGGTRQIGIPVVRDRILLNAVNIYLLSMWDPLFSDSSFAYRPGRSCHDAIHALLRHIRSGRSWYIKGDIRGCFDSLEWEYLSLILKNNLQNQGVRKLINKSFRVPLVYRGDFYERSKGVPQGSPVSPTLANLYLHQFDIRMAQLGYEVIRYADDWICMSGSRKGALRIFEAAEEILADIGIEINREKSGIGCLESETVSFLGYEINSRELASSSWKRSDMRRAVRGFGRFRQQRPRGVYHGHSLSVAQ